MSDATIQERLDAATRLLQAGRVGEAEAIYLQILGLEPGRAEALHLLGVIRVQQGRHLEAVDLIRRVVAANPGQGVFHCNLGVALSEMERHGEAIGEFRRAIALRPGYFEGHYNLANSLKEAGQADAAIASYERALEIRPEDRDAFSNLLAAWQCVFGGDAGRIYAEHRRWEERIVGPMNFAVRPHGNNRDPDRRLCVGYVSPDFREHSVSFFMEGLLAGHDPKAVEVFAYADSTHSDAVTGRLRKLVPQWRDIVGVSDEDVAEMVRKDGIDILVDLAGHTRGNRLLVFARKPAPIQVTYLGYPGTTGLAAMDYRLTDVFADPVGMTEKFYSEKLLRLPRSFVCYRPAGDSPEVGALPASKNGFITFGSFNHLAKINSRIIELWSEILKQTAGSRILIKNSGLGDEMVRGELLARFAANGIEATRVELRGRAGTQGEHLGMYGEMDIALDTFPYNGTTTSCEAMWMGVPMVTLAGETHAGRVGVSLLSNVGLEELIARTPGEYVKLAVDLASDLEALAEIRGLMREWVSESALMDGPGLARDVEAGYRQIWREWLKSLR
jgi:protein O-GlcNAc transferase